MFIEKAKTPARNPYLSVQYLEIAPWIVLEGYVKIVFDKSNYDFSPKCT